MVGRLRTQRQVSAGGVITRPGDRGPDVCLIARRREDGTVVWGLPKGHLEPGESPLDAALREVREETGLVGESLGKLGAITYTFTAPSAWGAGHTVKASPPHRPERGKGAMTRFIKTVHFFLMRFVEGDTAHHDDEVEEAQWYPVDEAMARLSFENERRMLRKAIDTLGAA
jgi:8-oxo-dGTP pyrophosphatase MutT (NUDIX family)